MKYAIVDADKAAEYGFKASHHRSSSAGKIVVNENELQMLGRKLGISSNAEVAALLGGDALLGRKETRLKTMRWKAK